MNGHDKFCPLWEELSPYVPQVQKSQGWRGAWQAEPWRFFLVIVIVVVNTITRARATRGSFFFFLPRPLRIQNGYMFICTYVTLSKLTQERKDTRNWWLPFLLLREGRNRFVQPDSLVFVWVFLVGYSCFSSYCQQHFVNAVSWENNQSWALQLGFFEFPQTSQGNCWDILSVMGKHQVCAPLYGWHDLG